jgi:hypothetical protein
MDATPGPDVLEGYIREAHLTRKLKRSTRKTPIRYNRKIYKIRNRVERMFRFLKHNRCFHWR